VDEIEAYLRRNNFFGILKVGNFFILDDPNGCIAILELLQDAALEGYMNRQFPCVKGQSSRGDDDSQNG
jgi:hypothetical protein